MNVAVVGVGRWGVNHVRVLSLLQSHLVGRLVVVDSDISRASQVAKTYHADTFYGSVEELSRREKDLDAVIVVVPTIYHYKVVDKLLDNYDVFVEKPLAETIEQGFNLVQKARRLGRVLAVGHIERFNPIVLVSRRMLEQLNGKILSFEAKRLGPGPARSYS
ncbi:MAG: Gfo/Idh/MocA family oxidoreductase, partial [Infirmifilum sp.]